MLSEAWVRRRFLNLSGSAVLGACVGTPRSPFRTRRFRLERAERRDAEWMRSTLNREGPRLGSQVELTDRGSLLLSRI